MNTCFCLGGEPAEFGEWRANVEVTPQNTHLKRNFFAADCARLHGTARGQVTKSVADTARSRSDVVSRLVKKETIQKFTDGDLRFCHLQSVDDYIHSYREEKRAHMRGVSLVPQQRRANIGKMPASDSVPRYILKVLQALT